jgi:3-mercaptopyruvate sulfurtransferase SseA
VAARANQQRLDMLARVFAFGVVCLAAKHVVSKGEIEAIVAQMGIRSDSQVIVYDDAGGVAAARVWWVLSFYGFPSVRVLSSGWRGLVPAGAPLETGMPAWDAIQASDPGFFQAAPRPDMLATADQAFEASTVRHSVHGQLP